MIDPETLAIVVSWVIPLRDISDVGTNRPNKFALAPSRVEDSNDKYTRYRNHTLAGMGESVMDLLMAIS